MSDAHSSSPPLPVKPERPEGSPLFWVRDGRPTEMIDGRHIFHGRWAKKIRGRLVYFGRGSHDDALADYNRQKTELHSGRKPRAADASGALTVHQLCTKFGIAKNDQYENGELSLRSLKEYGEA